MSKPAPAAKPDEIARRAAMNRYLDRTFQHPPEGSIFHPLYRWPSDSDADYAERVARHQANTPHR